MALTLLDNPVKTVLGVVQNLFAGFKPIQFIFKREDAEVVSVGSGVDNNVQIFMLTDIQAFINVGEFLYLSAPFDNGLGEYDISAEVVSLAVNTVTINTQFINNASSGYINFKQNYSVEMQILNPINLLPTVVDFNLQDDGNIQGDITIDVGIMNDLNNQEIVFANGIIEDERNKFRVEYREVFRDSNLPFTSVADEIIPQYATQQFETEEFINELPLPRIYQGYNNGLMLSHSDSNQVDDSIVVTYDELDLNQQDVTTGNNVLTLNSKEYGLAMALWDSANVVDASTRFIKFNGVFASLSEYNPADYNNTDYNVT